MKIHKFKWIYSIQMWINIRVLKGQSKIDRKTGNIDKTKKNKAVPASYKTPAVLLIYTVKCSKWMAVIEKRKRIMSNMLCVLVVLMSYIY